MKPFYLQFAWPGNSAISRVVLLALLMSCGVLASSQKWVTVTTPQFPVGVALQLTDGTIMVQQNKTSNWWRLSEESRPEIRCSIRVWGDSAAAANLRRP